MLADDDLRDRGPSHSAGLHPTVPGPVARSPIFALEDGLGFMALAAQALAQDEFSKCFEPKPLPHHPSMSLRYAVYIVGVLIRYLVLFPIRLTALLTGAALFAALLPAVILSENEAAGRLLFFAFCKLSLFVMSAWVRHHGRKPTPQAPHIFVANHTSIVDFLLLSAHRAPHATVAQVHGGIFGFIQRYALYLNGSLFFYRDEHRDKEKLARKMRAHTQDWRRASPLLIFPEGTCVNNEYTVLFHKGAFELGCAVCPAAIKYNKRLLDPYWNTREQSFTQHCFYIMTRWCLVADVWWLPPQARQPTETAIDFANRVKALISDAAGLKNLSWDGYMKNYVRQHDHEKLRRGTQERYSHALRRRLPGLLHEADAYSPKAASPVEVCLRPGLDLEPSCVVDMKNEILALSLGSRDDAAARLLSRSFSHPPEQQLLAHLSSQRDSLVKSWKCYSIMAQLGSSPADVVEREEQRLNYTTWRRWSKQRRCPALPLAAAAGTPADPLDPASLSVGIEVDEHSLLSDDEDDCLLQPSGSPVI